MTKKNHKLRILLFGIFLIPWIAFGQGPVAPIVPDVPGTSEKNPLITCGTEASQNKECQMSDLIDLVQKVLELTFAFGAFIAAAMFMYAGFLLITAVGNPTQIQKAKNVFKRVVVGFLIMFLAFITVSQVLKYLKVDPAFNNIIQQQ